mgnify:CR=1 FL=1
MKSFSVITKEELCRREGESVENPKTELAGLMLFGGTIYRESVKFTTENRDVLDRFKYLCSVTGIEIDSVGAADNSQRCTVTAQKKTKLKELLTEFEIIDEKSGLSRYGIPPYIKNDEDESRSFIRSAFLGGGTVIDPNKNYNLEIVAPYSGLSRDFSGLLRRAGFEFKTAVRKSKYVHYIKNSEIILDFLTFIGAYRAQMELINIKIEKEIRNDFNRTINSETANWEKTFDASVRQVKAIEIIADTTGLDELPDDLREIAELRLVHKSKSLSELGELLNPPLGKSGVNHRFKRIMAIAERLQKEE